MASHNFEQLRAGMSAESKAASEAEHRRLVEGIEAPVMMQGPLPHPTARLVEESGAEFDQENVLDEETLGELWERFPNNLRVAHVLLKVVVLNELYKTRVRAIDLKPLATHIAGLGIDGLLAVGSPDAADLIMRCPSVTSQYFSFASKYCSWHNPAAYPIYDTNVDDCLWWYRIRDGFTTYSRDSYGYPEFLRIVTAFRNHYGLSSFSFKQLDKFLLNQGYQLNAPCGCGSGIKLKSCHGKP